jgi:hypothetical protein
MDPADALYCGIYRFAGETIKALPEELFKISRASAAWRHERDSLHWLRQFTLRPRRLHVFFVTRLLTCWRSASAATTDLAAEADRLDSVAAVTGGLMSIAGEGEREIFRNTVHLQCQRLLHLAAASPDEEVNQALSILGAACQHDNLADVRNGAWKQLSGALYHLVNEDGSEASGSVDKAVSLAERINRLLSDPKSGDVPAPIRNCFDRLLAYLAMFKLGPGLWSSAIKATVSDELDLAIDGSHPHQHAGHGGRTLMKQSDTMLLAHWGPGTEASLIEMSHRGRPIMCVEYRRDQQHLQALPAEHLAEAAAGELLHMKWSGGDCVVERKVYLAANGTDIRFEEQIRDGHTSGGIVIRVPEQARILTTQDVHQAAIVLADGSCWQLRGRGGRVEGIPQGLALFPDIAEERPQTILWGLKRMPPKARGGKSQRADKAEGELPF